MQPFKHLTVIATIFLLLATAALAASPDDQRREETFQGVIVAATPEVVVIEAHDKSNQQSFMVADAVEVTIDGEPAHLTDLKKGDEATVAVGQDRKAMRVTVTRTQKT
jgi:hypothetical protein